MALGNPTEIEAMDSNLWLEDTGTSCHMTNSMDGMFNTKEVNTGIVFGNGQRLKAVYIGDKRGVVMQKNGARVPILMKYVKYVPQLYCHLFSISAVLKEGCLLEGIFEQINIEQKRTKLHLW